MKMAESSPNGQKTLWEKEKLLITSNFSFSHSVFKRLVLLTRKNWGLFGKGLSVSICGIVWKWVKGRHSDVYNQTKLLKSFITEFINETATKPSMNKNERYSNKSAILFPLLFYQRSPWCFYVSEVKIF